MLKPQTQTKNKIGKIVKTQSLHENLFFIGTKSLRFAYLAYLIHRSCIAPPFVKGLF